jgi:hypothetical protein
MEKIMLLVQGSQTETYGQFKTRIIESLKAFAEKENPLSVKLVITDFAPPKLSIIPFRRRKIASVSIRTNTGFLPESLITIHGISGIYRVTEAIPVAYEKSWKDGEPTPGVCLFTIFKQKKGISYDTFIDRWHNSHTPLSLRLHPLWNYSRNVVNEKLTETSADWDGIVEEHFRTKSDLLNPFKFFGKPLTIVQNMLEVYKDTQAFLDYKTLETYLATEYHILSN